MNFFKLVLIVLLFQSCGNESKKELQQDSAHLNHNHEHRALFLDSIPTKSVVKDTLLIDKILIDNDTILINRNTFSDFSVINSDLINYALTSDNYLFELNNIKNLFRYGKYGCYSNLIRLDTLVNQNCDSNFKYVMLKKVYIHDEDTNQHTRSNDTFLWKMNSDQYKELWKLIYENNDNEKIVNLQMETKPNDICMGKKVFNYNEVIPIYTKDN